MANPTQNAPDESRPENEPRHTGVLEMANAAACAAGAPLDAIHLLAGSVAVDPAAAQSALGFDDDEFAVLVEFARRMVPAAGPVVVCPRWPWTQRAAAAWGTASTSGSASIESLIHAILGSGHEVVGRRTEGVRHDG